MARNLLRAGFDLIVHDVNATAVSDAVDAGARDGKNLAGVAEAEIVVTMLPDTPEVEVVLLEPAGLTDVMRPGSVLVDMSTISPIATRGFAQHLRGRGIAMLDAPVSGGFQGAEAGTLSIMVGGDAAVLERCRPVLGAMGTTISHIGDAGAGQVCKACNQVAVAINIHAVAEALTLARKNGVDPARIRQALLGGFAQSRALDLHGQRVLDGNYKAGFRVQLQRKDLKIALEAGSASGTPLPVTALVQQLYGVLEATGRSDLDNSSLALLMHELAGIGPES
jgi:2-hydroxy-3-oxopropionate reductase